MNIKIIIHEAKLNKNGTTTIKYRIIHRREVRDLSSGFYTLPQHFDNVKGKVKNSHPNASYINLELERKKYEIQRRLLVAESEEWSMDKIVEFLKEGPASTDVFAIFQEVIETKTQNTAVKYRYTMQKIQKFSKRSSLSFEEVNMAWLEKFDRWMMGLDNSVNTRAIEMRNLRHVFNRAIDNEITTNYPFRKFKIARKTNSGTIPLTIDQLRGVIGFEGSVAENIARDVFIISFLLIGANISDIYDMEQPRGGVVRYVRNKTGRKYEIAVPAALLPLLDTYADEESMFNFRRRFANHLNFRKQLNKHLKVIGAAIGEPALTTYHARHTWATIASGLEIPKETIAAALGHGGQTVTDVYISYDQKKIDAANKLVVDHVFADRVDPH